MPNAAYASATVELSGGGVVVEHSVSGPTGFDRAPWHQPIPVSELPKEHPLILDGHSEDSLNQRSSRAIKKVLANQKALTRRPRPVTLADLILEAEVSNA